MSSSTSALKRIQKDDVMTFSVPKKLFLEMEGNVEGSLLQQYTWRQLQALTES